MGKYQDDYKRGAWTSEVRVGALSEPSMIPFQANLAYFIMSLNPGAAVMLNTSYL